MSAVAEPLIDYLRQLERQGQTHVHLDEQARLVLREFYRRARGLSNPQTVVSTQPAQKGAVESQRQAVAELSAPVDPVKETAAKVEIVSGSATDRLKSIAQQLRDSTVLKGLKSLRPTLVFSSGNAEADIMFVGEAPGYHDEQQGKPYVGPAGMKFDAILKAMGLKREEVYLTNMVKYRPAMANQTTNNRKPSPEELSASLPFVMAEIQVVKPKIIIALGVTATKGLLGSEEKIGELRGKFHQVAGIPLRATYHPSYLLHNEQTAEKRKVWEDMLAVMEQIKMPISDKQLRYFLPRK